jgi:putative ABC transport system permease protein
VRLLLTLARRELRGGTRGLRIVIACLALGVAAIAGVGSLREGIARGLAAQGSTLLGGDLDIESASARLPPSLATWFHARGAKTSNIVTLRSMLVAPSGKRLLVELKAVDDAWPMLGSSGLAPNALAPKDGTPGLAGEALVAERLGIAPGTTLRLGNETFRYAGLLPREPDGVATPSILGPRVLIPLASLDAAGLITTGSFFSDHLRVLLPHPADIAATLRDLATEFPNNGWHIRTARDAAPGLARFIDRVSLFLTLVGLTALLVGGIGVANGTGAWLAARARSIAVLRCLGASGGLVMALAMTQVMALAAIGIALGVVVGAALPAIAVAALGDVLPVKPQLGVFPAPLALAALFGLLTAASFSIWPLGRAARIPGAALFRASISVAGRVGWRTTASGLVLAACLVGLTIATAEDPRFAAGFCVAALATLALFRAGAWALMRLTARLPTRGASLRLGLGNLSRPGMPTPLMLVSVGLGLATLASVALVQGNVQQELGGAMPARAPSFYFIDIQPQELASFETILRTTPGVSDVETVPSLRAHVVAVNGVPAAEVHATQDTRWALSGDRGLTYAAAPPPGTELAAGQWWPADYTGPPLVSFDAGLAAGWGVHVGDTLELNVLGRDVTLRIANLRRIAWRTLALNFAMVASPGLLSGAPHTFIATARTNPAADATLLRRVTDALPNVSAIRVADVLASVASLFGQLGTALAATGSLALAAGALVLAGAVAAGRARRVREAVILKTLGASRAQIRAAWLVEFGVLGLAAGAIAALVGTAASWAVVRLVMHGTFVFLPGTLALVMLASLALMLLVGFAGTEAALRAKAAPLLRNE